VRYLTIEGGGLARKREAVDRCSSKIGSVDAYQGCGEIGKVVKCSRSCSSWVAQNEWMSVNDLSRAQAQVLVFEWKRESG
jgi:hypothetical protein